MFGFIYPISLCVSFSVRDESHSQQWRNGVLKETEGFGGHFQEGRADEQLRNYCLCEIQVLRGTTNRTGSN